MGVSIDISRWRALWRVALSLRFLLTITLGDRDEYGAIQDAYSATGALCLRADDRRLFYAN